ncbi:MAG: type II toxin-antitoxin system RelE/ParE family toxin [Aquabacterium sp.]
MKPALLRPQARQDQADEILYYRDKAGGRTAEKLLIAMEAALDQIEQHPRIGSPRLGQWLGLPEVRTWRVDGFSLMWFYRERADHLDVLRLLGERQDIEALWSEPEPSELHEPEPSYGRTEPR